MAVVYAQVMDLTSRTGRDVLWPKQLQCAGLVIGATMKRIAIFHSCASAFIGSVVCVVDQRQD